MPSGNQPQLPSNILDALQIFANTAWHNPSAFLHTHHNSTSRSVEYLNLQEHAIALRYLFGGALAKCGKILVRDEYHEALRALQIDREYERGAYIVGQPGIGKSSFLIYALVERLRDHKPVAVQLRGSDAFYAFFTHTCTLHALSDPSPLVQEDVWALSDLRVSTTTPLDIFLDVSAKVIQATLPSVKHWVTWSRYIGAQMFVMNIWSEEEIADLASLLELDVESMTTLAVKWGGVPRTLLQQCMNNESQQTWELRKAAANAVENSATLHTLDFQEADAISTIFFVLPLKDRAGNICRRRYLIRAATPTLEGALATALQRVQSKTRINFFLLTSIPPTTRSCAGDIYVNWFCSRLTSGRSFWCSWLGRSSRYERFHDDLASATGNKNIPVVRDVSESVKPPYCWIAPSGETFGVNCAIISKEAIFAFQATTSFQPLYPQVGLDKMKRLFPNASYWIYTFVGISDEQVNSVYMHPIDGSCPSTYYTGRSVVDPVEVGITYKTYIREEGEPPVEVDG